MGDLRHAVKTFRRRPGFAFSAALLLALGIGANTAVFGVVYAVLLRPLPYTDVDRLAFVWRGREPGHRHSILTGQHAIEIRQGATTLESFALVKGCGRRILPATRAPLSSSSPSLYLRVTSRRGAPSVSSRWLS